MLLSDARSRLPLLQVEEEQLDVDRALLSSLADWCERYTPLVALNGNETLLLDITGCAHLFGDEDEMLADCLSRLYSQGFTVAGAIADTVGAAWAVARSGGGVVLAKETKTALEHLPISLLRVDGATVSGLAKVGLTRIVDIYDRPRAPLVNRFGSELLRRLDQALGLEGEPISPRRYEARIMAERGFFEPIATEEGVFATLLSLAEKLKQTLLVRGEGGRVFELALFRVDGTVSRVVVGTSEPVQAPAFICRLFREKLASAEEGWDAGFGYDLIRLSALETQHRDAKQLNVDGSSTVSEDITQLVDRLGARLGIGRVGRFLPRERHLPEEQFLIVPAATVREDALYWPEVDVLPQKSFIGLPLRLLPYVESVEAVAAIPEGAPVRFRWRKVLFEIARFEGPERIAPPWWNSCENIRDYYYVEDKEGRRFWLFREGNYENLEQPPRWFLQGMHA